MSQFGPSNQTVQVTTGNVRTTLDPPNPTVAGAGFNLVGFPFPYPAGVFPNPLGSCFWDNAITVANPNGQPTKYRYVRYNSTANPAVQANPAAVWYKDATMTVVTGVSAEGWGGQSSFAGLMMPNTTDQPNLTAAILNANGGCGIWIAVAGPVLNVVSAAAAAGAQLFASQADWTTTGGFSTALVGAATVGRQSGYAFAASPSTVYVAAESI